MTPEKPVRLGEILLSSGIIDKLQLNTGLKYQREWDRKLGEALVELGFISEAILVKVLSKFLQVPTVELSQVKINPQAIQKVPKRLAEKYGVIPLDLEGSGPGKTLVVAMIDPTNLASIDEISFTSGCKVKPVVATHSGIDRAIRRHYGDERVVEVFFDVPLSSSGPSKEIDELDRTPPPNPPWSNDAMQSVEFIESMKEAPKEDESMIILRRGEETKLDMTSPEAEKEERIAPTVVLEEVETSAPEPSPPPTDRSQSTPSVVISSDRSSPEPVTEPSPLSSDRLLRALIQVLIRKGLIDSQEIQDELKEIK